MKKTYKFILVSLQVFCLFFTMCTVNIFAQENSEDDLQTKELKSQDLRMEYTSKKHEVSKKMFDLQESITETLNIEGNRYTYDESVIRSKISKFDLSEFNETFNTQYTIDSLTDEFISKISTFEIQPKTFATTEAYTCNINRTYKEWNYQREYRDTEWTNKIIKTYSNITEPSMVVSLINSVLFISHPIVGMASSTLLGWCADFVSALKSVNNGCGTVVDYNTLTALLLYYEADQQTFPGHF